MAEKKTIDTTVRMRSDDLKQLENRLNEVAKAHGMEIFDLFACWSPQKKETRNQALDIYEISIILRKIGCKERNEAPEDAAIYQQHITDKKQKRSQPSA